MIGCFDGNTKRAVASDILIFMLTGSWKAPVVYFFTASLCSETLQFFHFLYKYGWACL